MKTTSIGTSFKRTNPVPLDSSTQFDSYEKALDYATTDPTAYVGQVVAVGNRLYTINVDSNDARILSEIFSGNAYEYTRELYNKGYTSVVCLGAFQPQGVGDGLISIDIEVATVVKNVGICGTRKGTLVIPLWNTQNPINPLEGRIEPYVQGDPTNTLYKNLFVYYTNPSTASEYPADGCIYVYMSMHKWSKCFLKIHSSSAVAPKLFPEQTYEFKSEDEAAITPDSRAEIANKLYMHIKACANLDESYSNDHIRPCEVTETGWVIAGAASGTRVGNYATAEGQANVASSSCSHAEGYETQARGMYSHTEGRNTIITEEYTAAHMEGSESITSQYAIYYYPKSDGIIDIGGTTCQRFAMRPSWGSPSLIDSGTYIGDELDFKVGEIVLVRFFYSTWRAQVLAVHDDLDIFLAPVHGSASINEVQQTRDNAIANAEFLLNNVSEWTLDRGMFCISSLERTVGRKIYDGTDLSSSHTEGRNNINAAGCTHVEGSGNVAGGYAAHVEGGRSVCEAKYAHAEGFENFIATNAQAGHVEGRGNYVMGPNAHAEGRFNEALGDCSHVQGGDCYASGAYSTAEGRSTRAIHECSHTMGLGTDSTAPNSLVIGRYNRTSSGGSFIVGCGSKADGSYRANVFRIEEKNVYSAKTISTNGADYAEEFEWITVPESDSRGYFVTLEDDKIRFAQPGEFILGIISASAAILGNNPEDWNNRYLKDEFGCVLTEEYTYEEVITDPVSGDETTVSKTGIRPQLNPEYDPSQPYIERDKRPEWAAVGMLGVLTVRDDGTCQVNGYCTCADGGIATASETGYRVIKRINDHLIKVVFR